MFIDMRRAGWLIWPLIGGIFIAAVWLSYLLGGLQGRVAGEAYRALGHQNLEAKVVVLALEALEAGAPDEAAKHLNHLLDDIAATRAEYVLQKPLVFSTSFYRETPDRDYLGQADSVLMRYLQRHPVYAGPVYDPLIESEDAVALSDTRRAQYLAQAPAILVHHITRIGRVYSCDAFPYGEVDPAICETFDEGHEHYRTVAFYDSPGGAVIARVPAPSQGVPVNYLEGGEFVAGYLWAKYTSSGVEGYLPYDRWRMFPRYSWRQKLDRLGLSLAQRFL